MTAATIRRARPLLGTLVRIEAAASDEARAARAVDAGFRAAAAVDAAQSFHEAGSELSRLNAASAGVWLPLSAATAEVLRMALTVARASDGAFDPVIAASRAVARGALPRPTGRAADPAACWRDVELADDDASVRFARLLWIDFGGVAKGYAVDVAIEAMRRADATSGWVDAGGDLRVFGAPLVVALDARAPHAPTPRLELIDTALASSGGLAPCEGLASQAHVDGRDGRDTGGGFAAVVAPRCVLADALTKVVLARAGEAEAVLNAFGAKGYHLAPGHPWAVLGAEAT